MFIASINIALCEFCFSLSCFTIDCSYCHFSAHLSIPPRLLRQLSITHISADLSGSDSIQYDYNLRCSKIWKVKLFIYRPGQATSISRQWAHKVTSLSDIAVTLFCRDAECRWKDCQWKILNDSIGNRTRYPPAYSAVPQPIAPPRTPLKSVVCWTLSTWKTINNHRSINSG
jgi:hypothetical protein